MKKLLLTAAITLAMPFAAHAGSEFVEGDATFAGEAELGATLTTGNTDTSSFKARLALKQELGDWENQYGTLFLTSSALDAKCLEYVSLYRYSAQTTQP